MDEEFLDDLFEQLTERCLRGEDVDLEPLLAGREHLRTRAEELLELARGLSKGRAEVQPVQRFGGYEILRELGRGAMAVVFLARQDALGGREVALKVMATSITTSANDRRRFQAEAQALARLRHANIVSVHDVLHEDGRHAYTMEWVPDGSLADLLRRRQQVSASSLEDEPSDMARLSRRRWIPYVCRLGVDMARALHAVHAAGLTHRDVKPSNILIKEDGTPLLSDFGLVRDEGSSIHTQTGAFLGTLAFAAPEQIRGQDPDLRADVYSLGATLYQALTSQLPVMGATEGQVLQRIEAGQVVPLRRHDRRLPQDLETVVAKAMDSDPSQRYASADELADELERVLQLEPIQAVRAGPLRRAVKLARRNRRVVWSAALATLLTAALAAGVILSLGRRAELPVRVDAHVREAHLSLLQSRLPERVAFAVRSGSAVLRGPLVESAQNSLVHYDAALELLPGRADVASERDVVRLALARLEGGAPTEDRRRELGRRFPATARALPGDPATALRVPEDLSDIAPGDLRLLGLLAYLCGELPAAARVWEALEAESAADPLVEALLGHVLLATGRPALAYPRLLSASRTFDAAGFLHLATADAALRCGDAAVAERLIAAARAAPYPAASELVERVEADLDWVRGRPADALAAYERWGDGMAFLRRAQSQAARGRFAAALYDYSALFSNVPEDLENGRRLIRAARAWWSGLTRGERKTLLVDAFQGRQEPFGTVFGVLTHVERARATIAERSDARELSPPFLVDAARREFDLELIGLGEVDPDSIDALARRMRVDRLDLSRCLELDHEAREQLAELWLDPGGAEAAWRLLVERNLVLAEGERAYGARTEPVELPLRVAFEVAGLEWPFSWVLAVPFCAAGDLDGDGASDFLMGGTHAGAGRVCAYSGRDGTLLYLVEGEEQRDLFGHSVELIGDVDGDGVCDWAAGAIQTGTGSPGYVRVCSGADGRVLEQWTGRDMGGDFGVALAGLGDVDGDGVFDLAVSGYAEALSEAHAGTVRVISARGRELYRIDGADPGENFGATLANVGDWDGDGVADLAIGARRQNQATRARAQVVSGRTGATLLDLRAPEHDFGYSTHLGGGGDLDGDGIGELFIGHHWLPYSSESQLGGCAVLSADGSFPLELTGAFSAGGYGMDATGIGDLDGDGRSELAVGCWAVRSPRLPRVILYDSGGAEIAQIAGWYCLRRLGHHPLLPAPSDARFVALRVERWSRYSDGPLGGPATATVFDWIEEQE